MFVIGQFKNVYSPTVLILSGSIIDLKFVQQQKAYSPILVTPSGIFIDSKFVQ